MNRINIAIDGPAGAGKSTAAKAVAKALGIYYLDTGSMYRAVAYAVLKRGVDSGDKAAVKELMPDIDVKIVFENDVQKVYLDKEDITGQIRTPAVTKAASAVAVIPEVRLKMVEIQRQVAADYDVVMDGRDIGTYVIPDAKNKFFLTASITERTKRRYLEMQKKGAETDMEALQAEIEARDQNDSTRTFAPLKQAEDAVFLDTTDMTIQEVINFIKENIALG